MSNHLSHVALTGEQGIRDSPRRTFGPRAFNGLICSVTSLVSLRLPRSRLLSLRRPRPIPQRLFLSLLLQSSFSLSRFLIHAHMHMHSLSLSLCTSSVSVLLLTSTLLLFFLSIRLSLSHIVFLPVSLGTEEPHYKTFLCRTSPVEPYNLTPAL